MEHTVVDIAEMLTRAGRDVRRTGAVKIGRQVYSTAVAYSTPEGDLRVYIIGDPLPSVLRDSPTLLDVDGNPWYVGCYSPAEIKPEHAEYSPFGRWFMIFQSDMPHYSARGGTRPTRQFRWLSPR